jgi:Alkylmercury lyase
LNARQLELRRTIMEAFAATGAPPAVADVATLRELAALHVVALDADGSILMAHPFAAHHGGARVDSGRRTWWGNCAWDAFGIVAALRLRAAVVTANGVRIEVRNGKARGEAVFHVAVPAAAWWDDIVFT